MSQIFILVITFFTFLGNASIVPKNDLRIPVASKSNIGEQRFNILINKVVNPYRNILSLYGAKDFVVEALWESERVNASAGKKDGVYRLKVHGGLARYSKMTEDAFVMVLCHEIGHFVGGAPTWKPFNEASSEGQADYFASMKCFKRVFEKDNIKIKNSEVDSLALDRCQKVYKNGHKFEVCKKSSLAQKALISTISDLAGITTIPQFDTPDPYERMFIIFNGYPNPQCRLDTMFSGSLCDRDTHELMDMELYNKGNCSIHNGNNIGLRPKCWYVEREDKK